MDSWKSFIEEQAREPYYTALKEFVRQERSTGIVYPRNEDVFNAFKLTPLNKVKVVILGMDPYILEGQAHGLAFSVPMGVKPPPSLLNVFKEQRSDLGIEQSNTNGSLVKWAEQGVLLLNSILTVRAGKSGSHRGHGWEVFTDRAIELLNDQDRPIVFLLWGNDAKRKEALLNNEQHLVLKAAHPSPLSAYNGFYGCKHFSKCNAFLEANDIEGIDWKV